jgi:DNA-binding PadR family transcriptional regulator
MTHGEHFHGGGRGRSMRAAWRQYAAMMAGRRGRGSPEGDSEGGGPGRWGGGGWGRGGGRPLGPRLLGHGDLRILVLALIGEKPRHGYDLIRAIADRFAGAYTPSPGAVYPLLTMLEEEDLVSSAAEGAKKLYTLTPQGEAWLKENDAAVQGILARIDMAASHYSSQTAPEEVWEAWKTLKQAMNMPRAPWTKAESDRVCAILAKAARDIVGKG